MELKYRAVENRRTPSPPPRPLSTVTYVSGHHPLRGCEFALGGFPSNVSVSRVFQTSLPVNVGEAFRRELEKEHIRRELEKEEIRREILAREMARRRELEEEVRREIATERALGIPMGISFRERVSMSHNQRMNSPVNKINVFDGPQPRLPSQIDIRQETTKDKVIILDKPYVDSYGAKRKTVTPPVVDDNKHSGFSLQKKPKQLNCALCQITATSEKGLNDHLQGKKHKAKETSLRTQKIGLDARPNSQTLQFGITPVDTVKLEPRKEDRVVQKSPGLGGLDNEIETATSKVGETNALTTRKKFKFYCAFCQVQTCSEIVMQSHTNGKKHLANMKKFSQKN